MHRIVVTFLLSIAFTFVRAQQVDVATLPAWMAELVTGVRTKGAAAPKGSTLHTNAFIGTWTVEMKGGKRIEYWGDQHRIVLRELNDPSTLQRATLLDLRYNIKLQAHWGGTGVHATVSDLHIPQAGYFHDIWNDSLTATGRTATILGQLCHEHAGTSNSRDSSWYWTTTAYPKLFADLRVWGRWLTDGDLEHLLAFADRNAKAALRISWGNHEYGPSAGSMEFISIVPGKSPIPDLPLAGAIISEERLAWINNSSTGRLPDWMRAFLGHLPADPLPAGFTPPAVDRGIPDNGFIGTFTAETPSMIIGLRDEKNGRDTTHRLAKYSYWSDARRAVLILDDPDDEGYLFYAVDLDNDVVMASHNEGHGHVIPKVEIATLEDVGLKEFGPGLELEFVPQGQYRTILGRKCELHTTSERFLHFFMIPKESLTNPIFDIRNWMVPRMGQKFKDIMFFGLADRPMPLAVMATQLTSYRRGKAKPPVVDLSRYIVRDGRLRQRRMEYEEREAPEIRHYDAIEMEGTNSPDVEVMMYPPVASEPSEEIGSGTGAPHVAMLDPAIDPLMKATTNRFIGSAVMRFSSERGTEKISWTVRYASDSTRMVIIGKDGTPGITEHTRAYLIDRASGTETLYRPAGDGIHEHSDRLNTRYTSPFPPATLDSIVTGTRKLLGRTARHRSLRTDEHSRETWADESLPSLFHDVLSARKSWGGVEVLLRGPMIASTRPGMPIHVTYTYKNEETMIMEVIELKPGPVDPAIFKIDANTWKDR